MKHLTKTYLIASLFLIPIALLCNRPVPVEPELLPLPFKIQEPPDPKPLLKLSDLKRTKTVLNGPLSAEPYGPAGTLRESRAADLKKMKNLSFNYGALEVQERDAVRLKGAKVGVDYHLDKQQSVGVEGSQQIYDRQDAGAWDKGGKDESTAGIKYKLIF